MDTHFVDGRKIYYQTFKFRTASAEGEYDTNIALENVDNICFQLSNSYIYTDNGHTYASLNTYYLEDRYAWFNLWFDASTNHIMYSVGNQYINSDAYVTISYTKTTEERLNTPLIDTEQFTGMYYKDGKKIYMISKELLTNDAVGVAEKSNITLPEVETVFLDLDNSYYYNEQNKTYNSINTYYSENKAIQCWFNVPSKSIYYIQGKEDVNTKVFLTIRYTKTEDTITNSIDNKDILSEKEVFTGEYLDGNKIYRISKSFITDSIYGTSKEANFMLPAANIVMIDFKNSYLFTDNGRTYTQLNTFYNANAKCQCWFNTQTKKIRYHLGSQYISSNVFITLRYTKNE